MSALNTPTKPPIPATATATRRFTRDELIRLGQSAKPWEFLPLVIQALRALPDDHALRFLAAANFARLGLVTPAREQLATLPELLHSDPNITALNRAIAGLPSDQLTAESRIQLCRDNLAAFRSRGHDFTAAFDLWAAKAAATQWLATRDRNIIRRIGAGTANESWQLLGDHAGAAEHFARAHLSPPKGGTGVPPVDGRPHTLEGIDPPWLLVTLCNAFPRQKDGFQTSIRIVQSDPYELLDALALADLRHIIADERVSFFVGADAAQQLSTHLRARLHTIIGGPYIPLLSTRTRATPAIAGVISEAESVQLAEADHLHAQVAAHYANRDRAWWTARYQTSMAAAPSPVPSAQCPVPSRPLRVLIPTCRYSTFIQHSSADLAAAFRAAGWEAQVLIEPDDHSHFSSLAYLRPFAEFQPDLVVLINFTRAQMNGADPAKPPLIPPNIPFVCWIQDAMPHLFDASIGARQTDLDFLIGHTFPELFDRYNYPRQRALRCSAAANPAKFHDAPTSEDTPVSLAPRLAVSPTPARRAVQSRYDCEIAYVSHHSEPPAVLCDRLAAQFTEGGASIRQTLARIADLVETEVRRAPDNRPYTPCSKLVEQALAESSLAQHSAPSTQHFLPDLLTRQFADPYADRLIRNDTLIWAADAADRRGWRFKLYGRGWESHPRLAPYAAGELPHNDQLRTAYQSAAIHLQVTIHTLVHQRLFECLLSGGFPLCRLHQGELAQINAWMFYQASQDNLQAVASAWPKQAHRLARFADSPWLMLWATAMQRLGLFDRLAPEICGHHPGPFLHNAYFDPAVAPRPSPQTDCAFWHLGQSAEHFFHSAATLESRIAAVLERPDLRSGLIRSAANRVRSRQTYDTIVRSIVELVTTALNAP
jgi:hypothetical protein